MNTGEQILSLLPATRAQLIAELGLCEATVRKWLNRLKATKQIYVGKYDRTKGDFAAVFYKGDRKDAARPKKLTGAQYSARYRKSLHELGLYEDHLADRRKYWARTRAKVPSFAKDSLTALLYKRI